MLVAFAPLHKRTLEERSPKIQRQRMLELVALSKYLLDTSMIAGLERAVVTT